MKKGDQPEVFRTVMQERPKLQPLHYRDGICTYGSCFSEHIAARMQSAKLDVTSSPFGIMYNPVSIKEGLRRAVSGVKFAEGELIQTNELWHTWIHHGGYSGTDQAATLARMNEDLNCAYGKLNTARCLVLTVGAANVYELGDRLQAEVRSQRGEVVSQSVAVSQARLVNNCHKAPASMFTRRRLSVQECTQALIEGIEAVRSINPDVQVWLSVSPVKHLRDGMTENLLSKSTLLLACEAVSQTLENVHYLPVYEIVTEDLRDYRFYAADMCHPNELAIDYVWDWFRGVAFDAATQEYIQDASRLHLMQAHRPLHPDTEAWGRFVEGREAAERGFGEKWGV
jgi:GSCFA family